jgi:putative endonuclease
MIQKYTALFAGHSGICIVSATFSGMTGKLTRLAIRALDAVSRSARSNSHPAEKPEHLLTGQRGEEDAYFYLREHGYVIVARNFRSPRHKGEIDMIGWDGSDLCFIEVKTRKRRSLVPAEMAVDAPKEAMLRATARAYLRRMKQPPSVRFDVVSLYYDGGAPQITLFKNAFPMS